MTETWNEGRGDKDRKGSTEEVRKKNVQNRNYLREDIKNGRQ